MFILVTIMGTICELQQQIPSPKGKQGGRFRSLEPGMYTAFVIHYLAAVDYMLEAHLDFQ